MRLERLDRRGRVAMEAALRAGEPVLLDLERPPPIGVRLDEIVPLCHDVVAWDDALTLSLRALLPPPARPGHGARVTAVVPTHRRTPLGLTALRGQDVEVEVLVLANGPARPEGDRVVRVPWEGHGRTRQRGVELATGEYVLFTVDDALPCGAGFVRTLVEAIEEGSFDAVYARQVPWPTSDPVTRDRLRAWTPPGRCVVEGAHLDHVAALHRRATLLAHPLPDVPIAEDLHWGRGRRVGYVPTAPVAHAHRRTPGALWRRTLAVHREHLALGEAPRIPTSGALLGALPGIVGPVLAAGPREVPNQVAELLAQYAAARRGAS